MYLPIGVRYRRSQSRCHLRELPGKGLEGDPMVLSPALSPSFRRSVRTVAVLPNAPWSGTGRLKLIKNLLILEGVHALPETLVAVGPYAPFGNHASHGLVNKFLFRPQIPENFLAQNKIATVHPDI